MRKSLQVIMGAAIAMCLVASASAQAEEADGSLRGLKGEEKPTQNPLLFTDVPIKKDKPSPEAAAGSGCSDRHSSCKTWSKNGYCRSQYVWQNYSVRNYWCRRSCAVCCYNYLSDSQCNSWRKWCYKNAGSYYWHRGSTVDSWCPVTCAKC